MKKLLILILTIFCFTFFIKASFVQAQTPTPATQSADDANVVLNIIKLIFSQEGSPQDVKSIEEYQKNYLTPGAQITVPAGATVTPGPSPTPDVNSQCNTSKKGYYACKLVEEIRRVCGGTVTANNIECLDKINLPGKDSNVMGPAIGVMKLSALSFNYLQCVGFAQAALYIMSNGNSEMLQSHGNAVDWIGDHPGTFAVINNDGNQKLQDGDVPIWDYETYGHIAIYIGGGQIAEGNFDAKGMVNIRPVRESSPGLIGWLRPL